jgi:hypothetical protein
MYNFNHQNYHHSYFNSKRELPIYKQIEKLLVVVLIALSLFMTLLFSFENQKNQANETTSHKTEEVEKVKKPSPKELQKIITQRIVKKLQAEKKLTNINDKEIKDIVSKVIYKIETSSKHIAYTEQQGE